jgi:succinyl-CoA synthetase alpha subunit
MSILVDESTMVLVQGITGKIGAVQTGHMKRYGTKIVAGVTPGKGGSQVEDIPVFDSVAEARGKYAMGVSVLFVPAAVAEDSCIEAMDAGIKLILLITEHVPVHDFMRIRAYAQRNGVRVIGPTTPGVISPGKCKIGIMPANLFTPGPVGIISRSGTLAYEIGGSLSSARIGQTTVVGMGADPVVGTDLIQLLELFERDADTQAVVVVGEVGGTQEERAAQWIRHNMTKPVVAYIAGVSAPQGVRMGHAGAIAARGLGSAESKIRALQQAGVQVASTPGEIPRMMKKILDQVR